MKNLSTSLAVLGLLFGNLALCGAADAIEEGTLVVESGGDGSQKKTTYEELIPDFLNKKPHLRSASAALEVQLHETKDHDDRLAQISLLGKGEKLNLMKDIRDSLTRAEAIIEHVPLTDTGVGEATLEEVRTLTAIGRDYAHKAVEVMDDALSFLFKTMTTLEEEEQEETHSSSQTGEDTKTTSATEEQREDDQAKTLPIGVPHNATTQVSRRLAAPGGGDDRPPPNKGQQSRKQDRQCNYQKERRRARAKFSRSNLHHHGPSSSHHARKLQQFQEATFNGDIHAAFSSFNTGQPSSDGGAGVGGRRNAAHQRRLALNRARLLTKEEQCDLLADCVLGMTSFDAFVYYCSDDVDPSTGKVDENLLKFHDERHISDTYKTVTSLAKDIKKKGAEPDLCNDLLQKFHRTIEHGEIPEWEGASVNQVCLAEGTTVHVEFGQIATALVDTSFVNGYNKVSEETFVEDTRRHARLVKEQMAVEPFRCAEQLFYHGDRIDQQEEFPFGGCGGKNTKECSIKDYKFPVRLDIATRENKVKRFESIKKRIRCDAGHEMKTREQCIEAGQAVGGSLRDGDVVTGDFNQEPCGCFIWRGDKTVHWNPKTSNCKKSENWMNSAVCKERRNRDDHELIQFKDKCESGYEVNNVQECEEAAQALGGELFDGNLPVGRWNDMTCGCNVEVNGKINFNQLTGNCRNGGGHNYQNVCKRNKNKKHVAIRKRSKCDPGFEIKTKEECTNAAVGLGGNRYPETYVGDWDDKPCGCSIQHDNKAIHFDYGSRCKNLHNWKWDVGKQRDFEQQPVVSIVAGCRGACRNVCRTLGDEGATGRPYCLDWAE